MTSEPVLDAGTVLAYAWASRIRMKKKTKAKPDSKG
jgi:hypothetical protein